MRVTSTKKTVLALFVFIYIPFLWNYGYKYISTTFGDFAGFYWGAKLAFVEHRSPYTIEAFSKANSQLGQPVFAYLYPPPSLLVFSPLTLLPFQAAKLLMLVVNHICVLLFIYLFFFKLIKLDVPRHSRELIIALSIVYIFTYNPIIMELFHRQIDLVVLLCLCLTWYAMKQNARSWLVALPLSVAILIKTYPVLFLLLLLTKKRYGAVAWVCSLLLFYTVIAYLVLPQSVWSEWFVNVLPSGGYGRALFGLGVPVFPWNQSINGFTARMFLVNDWNEALWPNPRLARIVPYLLSLCVVATTVGVSYLASRRHEKEMPVDFEFSLYLLMMFIVAPLSWEQHLVFALPAALIAIRLLLSSRENYLLQMIVIPSLFLLAWDLPIASQILKRGVLTLGISVKLYAVVVLWLFFVVRVHRFARSTQP